MFLLFCRFLVHNSANFKLLFFILAFFSQCDFFLCDFFFYFSTLVSRSSQIYIQKRMILMFFTSVLHFFQLSLLHPSFFVSGLMSMEKSDLLLMNSLPNSSRLPSPSNILSPSIISFFPSSPPLLFLHSVSSLSLSLLSLQYIIFFLLGHHCIRRRNFTAKDKVMPIANHAFSVLSLIELFFCSFIHF